MKKLFLLITSLTLPLGSSALADWPQWRGPYRNGIAYEASASLPPQLDEENPPAKLWEFTGIPSDHDGGHGSVAIADGKLYVAVVWHRDEPTETRQISSRVLSDLGHRGTRGIPPEIVEKMETDRMSLGRSMRGAALDEYAKKWVEENLDEKTQLSLGSWVSSRFKKGKAAIPLAVFDVLVEKSQTVFASQKEMEEWVNAQDFEDSVKQQVIAAVPATVKAANDVILCLDAASGEELWRFETPGEPTGRASSSTPAVESGKVFAALSTHLYCVDTESGRMVWKSELKGKKGPASSPLVSGGTVFLQQNHLSAFDAETGSERWQNKDAKGTMQSPAYWKNLILCNAQKELVAVDRKTGETKWMVAGGGQGTPVVAGDIAVVSSSVEGKNVIAYRLAEGEPEELWTLDFVARRYSSSPVIYEGHVYHLGSERHLCIGLESGEIVWERKAQSSISSPLLANGRLLVYENRGGFVSMLKASPDEYTNLGRAKVGALYCASPALVGKDLFLRTKESVACYRLP